MKHENPLFLCDFYKIAHHKMYVPNMTKLYSNFTPRKSRIVGIDKVVVFGMQYLIKEYLIDAFNTNFFNKPLDEVVASYTRILKHTVGIGESDCDHIIKLHKLGYLPIQIKSLPEGSLCPIKVPTFTITNTHPEFAWLVNYLETLISNVMWHPTTTASIAFKYREILTHYAELSSDDMWFIDWQAHDFSMRGLSSIESSHIVTMGHILSFTGSDSIPAILCAEEFYNADVEKEMVCSSVGASEHSIMCSGGRANELETYRRLITDFPTGILSIVSDTWDLWNVATNILVELKEQIMARDGKVVIRPDSGNPTLILCGNPNGKTINERKGLIELLWDVFGGTINSKGYKVLDSHIGAIYGDSITLDIAKEICEKLIEKGFASTNVVLGIGSYTYNYVTRDTFGYAMKATYCEVTENGVTSEFEMYKDPITDDGTKKSLKGLLRVDEVDGVYVVKDQCTKEEEMGGCLETVFLNGKLVKETSLSEIRSILLKK